MQGLGADSQHFGGAGLVPARVFERQLDQLSLRLVDAHPSGEPEGITRRRRGVAEEVGWKLVDSDLRIGGENHCAFDDVPEFSNVAWPGVSFQRVQCGRLNSLDLPSVTLVELHQEGLNQQRNILATLSQRRHRDRHDVDPVVQVLA